MRVLHELYSRPKANYIHVTREPLPAPGGAAAAAAVGGKPANSVVSPEPTSREGSGAAGATDGGGGGRGADSGVARTVATMAAGGGGETAAKGAESKPDTASEANDHVRGINAQYFPGHVGSLFLFEFS